MDPLLRIGEAAKLLGVSTSWLYKAAASGTVPTLKVGRLLRFSAADLQKWLSAQSSGQPAQMRG